MLGAGGLKWIKKAEEEFRSGALICWNEARSPLGAASCQHWLGGHGAQWRSQSPGTASGTGSGQKKDPHIRSKNFTAVDKKSQPDKNSELEFWQLFYIYKK